MNLVWLGVCFRTDLLIGIEMFNLQARAAAGFSKMASPYGRQWETMLDGEANALVLEASDASYFISACIDADRDDGLGAHTEYRVVEVGAA